MILYNLKMKRLRLGNATGLLIECITTILGPLAVMTPPPRELVVKRALVREPPMTSKLLQ